MIGALAIDLITGGSSFVGSAITTLLSKIVDNGKDKHVAMMNAFSTLSATPKTEEDKQRAYALAMKRLEMRFDENKSPYNDIKDARAMQSRFVGITRRGIAWSVIPLFMIVLSGMAFYSAWTHQAAIAVPVKEVHTFLFGLFKTETTAIKQVLGLLIPPWLPTLIFMIAGFYFGRETMRRL